MKERPAESKAKPDIAVLHTFLAHAGLGATYERFLAVTEGPSDGRCLVVVASRLSIAFQNMPFWAEIEPFERWNELVAVILDNRVELVQKVGTHLLPDLRTVTKNGIQYPIHPMYGWIEKHPIFAMLCNQQDVPALRSKYGALQLQVLHARWLEWKRAAKEHGLDPLDLLNPVVAPAERQVRLSETLARSMRDLSSRDFADFLQEIKSCGPPDEFREFIENWDPPVGLDFVSHSRMLKYCCLRDRGVRNNQTHTGGKRWPSRSKHLEYFEYGSLRVGVPLTSGREDGGLKQEIIFERGEDGQEAFLLGLHPLEIAGGRSFVRSTVPGAETIQQAIEISRNRTRRQEMDYRLFPWSANQLRLEDFRRSILPALAKALVNPSISPIELELAVLAAVSIETGRTIEDVLKLNIERRPNAPFAYVRPQAKDKNGWWYWKAIGPDYRSKFDVPAEMETPRAKYLEYPASRIVAALIERHCRTARIRTGELFRSHIDYSAAFVKWVDHQDPSETCTPTKLARLQWRVLHQLTGGELASTSLLLGVLAPQAPQAAVELYYAVLGVSEARAMYLESSRLLWGVSDACRDIELDPISQEKIVGIRAYPKLSIVQKTVDWLREGSQKFFGISPMAFDRDLHMELLNRAVLYVVWHQFFMFATRAIRDGYQDSSVFARRSGIGKLSDKDFDDNHKTRMIWADQRLLTHMMALEQRLARLVRRLADSKFPENSPVWFLGPTGTILPITPTTIREQLGSRFPFEVNAPRKVMRHLLRLAGLSHEHAEVFMGHWWQAREPWSPFSSFDWSEYLERLDSVVPPILMEIGFTWIPGEAV